MAAFMAGLDKKPGKTNTASQPAVVSKYLKTKPPAPTPVAVAAPKPASQTVKKDTLRNTRVASRSSSSNDDDDDDDDFASFMAKPGSFPPFFLFFFFFFYSLVDTHRACSFA
jgi:hypothetical protein